MLCYVMPSSDRITRPTTHTHPFNGPFPGTTWVSRYQKGKTNLDFTEARDSEWPWHQLSHMQDCTSLQTDNHASTPPLCFYRPDALPAAQPTASKHWRPNTASNTHTKWPRHWAGHARTIHQLTLRQANRICSFGPDAAARSPGTLLTDTGRRDDVQQLQRSIFARPASPLLDSLI